MPKKVDEVAGELKHLQQMFAASELAKAHEIFKHIDGRDLYEMPSRTMMAHTVIDRPVSLALNDVAVVLKEDGDEPPLKPKRRTENSPDIDEEKEKEEIKSVHPVEIMTNAMVDGVAVIKIDMGWEFIEIVPYWEIARVQTDGKGLIKFLRIQFREVDDNGKKGLWFRRDYVKEPILEEREDGTFEVTGMQAFRIDWPKVRRVEDFEQNGPISKTEIEFIPFVAFEWNKRHESFLMPSKFAFIELERVSREISGENVKHSTRKLFVKDSNAADAELGVLGDQVNLLSEKGDAFYPDPHAAVIQGFFKERKDAVEFIENATGVVATEKIVALSGVSRITAMKGLVDLSKKIRRIFTDGMIETEQIYNDNDIDPRKMTILYPPIGMMIVDVNNQSALLKEAKDDGIISDHEYRESIRMMLSL